MCVRLNDLLRVELDVDKDDVVIEYAVPVDGRRAVMRERVHFSPSTPQFLKDAVKALAQAAVRAINEGLPRAEVPCDTCTGACCAQPVHDTTRVRQEDVDRLRDHAYLIDFYDEPTYAGYVGQIQFKETKGRLACAFLTEDGRCGVYEQRPEICRTCDPWDCKDYDVDLGKLLKKVKP